MRTSLRVSRANRPADFRGRSRLGAVAVETAVSLLLLLSVLFSMLDLGLLVFQQNMLSLAARRAAREAIVRGSTIDPASGWGPNTSNAIASDGSPIASVVAPYCVTMASSKTNIVMSWPDGTNQIDDRVIVSLTYPRSSMTPLTAWMGTIKLSANATMRIVH